MIDEVRIRDRVREFIRMKFPISRKLDLNDDGSLLDSGIIDSLGVLGVVEFLETEFEIELNDDDLVAETFESIDGIAGLVRRKKNGIESSEP